MQIPWWWIVIALSAGTCFGYLMHGAHVAMSDIAEGRRQ
jgi:hypothetical protein